MASKHFRVTENGYKAVITHDNGGRVRTMLWRTDVEFDKELNVISKATRSSSGKNYVNEQDVDILITYAKGQVKKLSQVEKTADFIVDDVYGSGIVIKTVKLKANGEPNLKEAGSKITKIDIKPATPEVKASINALSDKRAEILELELKLSKMKSELRDDLKKVFNEA